MYVGMTCTFKQKNTQIQALDTIISKKQRDGLDSLPGSIFLAGISKVLTQEYSEEKGPFSAPTEEEKAFFTEILDPEKAILFSSEDLEKLIKTRESYRNQLTSPSKPAGLTSLQARSRDTDLSQLGSTPDQDGSDTAVINSNVNDALSEAEVALSQYMPAIDAYYQRQSEKQSEHVSGTTADLIYKAAQRDYLSALSDLYNLAETGKPLEPSSEEIQAARELLKGYGATREEHRQLHEKLHNADAAEKESILDGNSPALQEAPFFERIFAEGYSLTEADKAEILKKAQTLAGEPHLASSQSAVAIMSRKQPANPPHAEQTKIFNGNLLLTEEERDMLESALEKSKSMGYSASEGEPLYEIWQQSQLKKSFLTLKEEEINPLSSFVEDMAFLLAGSEGNVERVNQLESIYNKITGKSIVFDAKTEEKQRPYENLQEVNPGRLGTEEEKQREEILEEPGFPVDEGRPVHNGYLAEPAKVNSGNTPFSPETPAASAAATVPAANAGMSEITPADSRGNGFKQESGEIQPADAAPGTEEIAQHVATSAAPASPEKEATPSAATATFKISEPLHWPGDGEFSITKTEFQALEGGAAIARHSKQRGRSDKTPSEDNGLIATGISGGLDRNQAINIADFIMKKMRTVDLSMYAENSEKDKNNIGTTATVAVVTNEGIAIQSAGDSPAYALGSNGKVYPLNILHASDQESEYKEGINHQLICANYHTDDYDYRQYYTNSFLQKRLGTDEVYLIMGSDGFQPSAVPEEGAMLLETLIADMAKDKEKPIPDLLKEPDFLESLLATQRNRENEGRTLPKRQDYGARNSKPGGDDQICALVKISSNKENATNNRLIVIQDGIGGGGKSSADVTCKCDSKARDGIVEVCKDAQQFSSVDNAAKYYKENEIMEGLVNGSKFLFLKQRNNMGADALHLFSGDAACDSDKIDKILQQGLSLDSLDNNGKTPFHYACQSGNPDVIKKMAHTLAICDLARDAKVSRLTQEDNDGNTPLDYLGRREEYAEIYNEMLGLQKCVTGEKNLLEKITSYQAKYDPPGQEGLTSGLTDDMADPFQENTFSGFLSRILPYGASALETIKAQKEKKNTPPLQHEQTLPGTSRNGAYIPPDNSEITSAGYGLLPAGQNATLFPAAPSPAYQGMHTAPPYAPPPREERTQVHSTPTTNGHSAGGTERLGLISRLKAKVTRMFRRRPQESQTVEATAAGSPNGNRTPENPPASVPPQERPLKRTWVQQVQQDSNERGAPQGRQH